MLVQFVNKGFNVHYHYFTYIKISPAMGENVETYTFIRNALKQQAQNVLFTCRD